jgi:hypothetical protein
MKRVFSHIPIPKKSVGFLPSLGGMCLFLFTSFLVHAQERAKDEIGKPLPGAGILVETDSDGVTMANILRTPL